MSMPLHTSNTPATIPAPKPTILAWGMASTFLDMFCIIPLLAATPALPSRSYVRTQGGHTLLPYQHNLNLIKLLRVAGLHEAWTDVATHHAASCPLLMYNQRTPTRIQDKCTQHTQVRSRI
mmetsp:Transcript_32763/g.72373  ORF Transcript_32763/g.72373 Transcript_32763/m.72373 type:complete len:121 (+) Transcript_32763:91-453(+)